MNDAILVAVNDSPAGFAAAKVAIAHARQVGATLYAVTVVPTDEVGLATGPIDVPELADRREKGALAALRHVAALGLKDGVEVVGNVRHGSVATEILEEARAVDCGLIVMALVDRPGHATPYIGSHTLAVLEFAQTPVMVVPAYHGAARQ